MATVETALGPVATTELGPTLMHEHIVTRSPGVQENWPHLWDRNAILALAEQKMADLYRRGIRALVDLTTVDLGRDIDLIVGVARRSRVHVIVRSMSRPRSTVVRRSEEHTSELQSRENLVCRHLLEKK